MKKDYRKKYPVKVRPFQPMIPVGIYLLKVNNRNIRTLCEICSKPTIKTSTGIPTGICITTYDLLLQKCPDTTILHVGTNNCLNESSLFQLDKIFNVKTLI